MSSFFELGGGRELVSEEKAMDLLKTASTDPVHIRLSNKSFDNGAAQVLATYLESLTAVRVADISDIIAGRPEDEALRTLKIICSSLKKFPLVEINVSDNAFGGKGVEACRDILIGKEIEKLYMCNNGLSAEACALVCHILLEDGCPPLKLLHFYNNMSGSAGATAVSDIIKACPELQDLRFSATRSGPEGCLSIAEAIGTVSKLKRVDLSDNNVGANASEVLAQGLARQTELEYLNLRDDGLNEEGLKSILSALGSGSFRALTHLDLSGNELDEDMAGKLASALECLPALRHLLLDDNELTSDGAKILASSLYNLPQLQTLSCNGCELTASGAYSLARAVAKFPTFVKLDINGNQVVERGLDAIHALFSTYKKIVGDLDDNDEDGDDDLEDELAKDEDEVEGNRERNCETDALVAAMGAAEL